MAAKFVMTCLLAAMLTQLLGATCDPTKVQGGMTTCQMQLGTGTDDFCIRYAAYTKCIDNVLAGCNASVTFTSSMQTATAAYSSQLEKCSSSGSSSGNEKASRSDPQNSGTEKQAHSSQAGPSPPPAEIEATVLAFIQISNPLALDLDRYVEEVKKATGVAQLPKAVVKAFEIVVKYVFPDTTLISEAMAAVMKANDLAAIHHPVIVSQPLNLRASKWSKNWDIQVHVIQSRVRLEGCRFSLRATCKKLNFVEAIITVPDKAKAAAVQTSAADVAALESEIDGHVSVAKAPVTTARVETKVKTAPSKSRGQLVNQIESVGSDVDGTIEAVWRFTDEGTIPTPSPSSASSNSSIVLAALLILLWAI